MLPMFGSEIGLRADLLIHLEMADRIEALQQGLVLYVPLVRSCPDKQGLSSQEVIYLRGEATKHRTMPALRVAEC
jgi:hypothetical protein